MKLPSEFIGTVITCTLRSWTFRKQPKFFDVVTYTGNGASSNTVNHSLGSVPGCIIVKCTSLSGGEWVVYHRSLASGWTLKLNTTDAETNSTYISSVTSTSFNTGPGAGNVVNGSGESYVAYLFAHNAGGFGLTGNDNVISCGSFTDTSGAVNLGYEPQFFLYKSSTNSDNWIIVDTMRGLTGTGSTNPQLYPNTTASETSGFTPYITATGFQVQGVTAGTYIYIAIRRGPMKVPTTGTSVYNAIARTGTAAVATVTGVGFAPDLVHVKDRTNAGPENVFFDRLRGVNNYLVNSATAAEVTLYSNTITSYNMDGISLGADGSGNVNSASGSPSYINHFLTDPDAWFLTTDVPNSLGTAGQVLKVNSGATAFTIAGASQPTAK